MVGWLLLVVYEHTDYVVKIEFSQIKYNLEMSKTSLGILCSPLNCYQLHYFLLKCQGGERGRSKLVQVIQD